MTTTSKVKEKGVSKHYSLNLRPDTLLFVYIRWASTKQGGSTENSSSSVGFKDKPCAGLASWLLMLLASFLLSSLRMFLPVTPGITGRCAGGVWAMGELRRSNRNLRS